MRKIKKAMALSLALAMGLSLVACGDKDKDKDKDKDTQATTTQQNASGNDATGDATEAPAVNGDDQGSVYNVYVWNEEFKSRVEEYYPGYEKVDATNGKVGDIEVKWNITPNEGNAYQTNLDDALRAQEDASANDKVDLFLVEADYALKYVDTPYTMAMSDIGITDADLSKQYKYTKDVMTDSEGVLKGVSWQGCPGVMFYNREIAKDVLGSDEPDKVQEAVKDWDTFLATAKTMKDKGYMMSSAAVDTYRVFSNNVTSKWVDDDKNINIDPNIKKWVDMAKTMVDAGQTTTGDLWGDEWKAGFFPEGKVFCYFGPMWEVNFSMSAAINDEDGNFVEWNKDAVAGVGGFGACEGPQGFFWGGTWICSAAGSDNTALTADIIRKLCTDNDIMKKIATDKDEFVNNQEVIAEIAADSSIGAYTLGNQNPYAMLDKGASKIDLSNLSGYDQGCNEEFQAAMAEYLKGQKSYDDAVASFEAAVKVKYPALDQ